MNTIRTLAISYCKMNYDPAADQLILLGDYVDRGPDSRAVVEQIMKLRQEWGVVVLKGNHDQMACDGLNI